MADRPAAKRPRSNDSIKLTDDEIRVVKMQFYYYVPAYPRFDALLHEYYRFLELKLSNPNVPLAPSFLINKLWHAHILSTREYLAFCERHNDGKFIHHDPMTATKKRGQRLYSITLDAFEDLFGEKPSDEDIWPKRYDQRPTKKRLRALEQLERQAGTSQVAIKQESDADDQNPRKRAKLKDKKNGKRPSNDGKVAAQGMETEEEFDEELSEQQDYLRTYKDRGTTQEELAEWHRYTVLRVATHEAFDPYDTAQCCNGHLWIKGEFKLDCGACRQSSEEIEDYFACAGAS